MHPSQHIGHWGYWLGIADAVYGYSYGDQFNYALGLVTAAGFGLIGSYCYLRQLWDSWQFKRAEAEAKFRREQALLDEKLKIEIEQLHRP